MAQLKVVCPHDCPDTCSMVVTVENGRATSLRGDRDHPFTEGYLCQKVSRYLERVYHPERLVFPQIRVGKKGEGKFRRATWDEAIRLVAERFQTIVREHGPQAILPYSYAGTMGRIHGASLDRRFFHRLGASLLDRTICATAGAVGCEMTLGGRAWIDPDHVERARFIVNWGSNTAVTNMHLWTRMHRARKAGATIVTIDPHRSKTAEKSDWWIPIRPGTDGALALALMHVIFRDGLEDRDYLERHCVGSDALKARVLAEYGPERVSGITGVPIADIERLAHAYATTRPAFLRVNYGMQRHGGGATAMRTLVCLPAVVGAWRDLGGGALLSTSRLAPFQGAALERPDLIPPGTRTVNMNQLAEALAGELPGPPVMGLYVYNANPAAVNPDQSRVLAGLRREDLFAVVHEQFPTDTAQYADVLLPATTQFEHFDLHNAYGHLYVQANDPIIAPLGEAKPNNEVFRLLARAMGFEPELFDVSDEQLARIALHEDRPERPAALADVTLDRLRAEGPIRVRPPREGAPFAEGTFPTPSGKCELYSQALADRGIDPLPHYVPPHEDPLTRPELAKRHPLQMVCPPAPEFLNSSFVNVDSLRAAAGEPRCDIHPRDAAARGIRSGDRVRVFNDRGRFLARAAVGETVHVGTVVSPGVWWNRYVEDGVNCNTVTSTKLTDHGGGATFFDNLVEVERAE